jgi:hypothetical protein
VRVRKHEFEILEGLPVAEYLLADISCEGMAVTSALETELSSRTKEASMSLLTDLGFVGWFMVWFIFIRIKKGEIRK